MASDSPVQPTQAQDFRPLERMIADNAAAQPDRRALVHDGCSLTYQALDAAMTSVAAALRRDGVGAGATVAIVAATTNEAVTAFLGALRAGCVPVPIAPSSTPEQLAGMVADSGAAIVFADRASAGALAAGATPTVLLEALADWLPPVGDGVVVAPAAPTDPFNIIYSSGTTGTPKGIVQTHAMRALQIASFARLGFAGAVTMVATPLYSNTTLVTLLPTLALGGTAVLLGKFDAHRFLAVAERERATHAMLVPVQYDRIMAVADFDRFDLSAFRLKVSTSAPFSPALKADVVARWPGALLEIYAMTEGGGTCLLMADAFPDKLHTVGTPAPGSDIRIIDEAGREVPRGAIGEVVGRSGMMMQGYHGRRDATDAAAWFDADGNRFIRHGDLGMFDPDGFLVLMGRTKDMIISGGFNVYPPDIEAVMLDHPGVAEAAVVGIPSAAWGETPYAFYVPAEGDPGADALVGWVNERVGKTQRLAGARAIAELPRNAIGKVLKRDLRDLASAA